MLLFAAYPNDKVFDMTWKGIGERVGLKPIGGLRVVPRGRCRGWCRERFFTSVHFAVGRFIVITDSFLPDRMVVRRIDPNSTVVVSRREKDKPQKFVTGCGKRCIDRSIRPERAGVTFGRLSRNPGHQGQSVLLQPYLIPQSILFVDSLHQSQVGKSKQNHQQERCYAQLHQRRSPLRLAFHFTHGFLTNMVVAEVVRVSSPSCQLTLTRTSFSSVISAGSVLESSMVRVQT